VRHSPQPQKLGRRAKMRTAGGLQCIFKNGAERNEEKSLQDKGGCRERRKGNEKHDKLR